LALPKQIEEPVNLSGKQKKNFIYLLLLLSLVLLLLLLLGLPSISFWPTATVHPHLYHTASTVAYSGASSTRWHFWLGSAIDDFL